MVLLDIYVSFGPWIPNHHMVPTVSPGHNEQTQGIVIEYVHAIVFHTGRYATTGLCPLCEQGTGVVVPENHCEKRLVASVC